MVQVKNPSSLMGKKIEDPNLKQAGLEIQIVDPKAGELKDMMGEGPVVAMTIKGDIRALTSVEVVDGKGQDLSQGGGSTSSGGVRRGTAI